MCHECALRVEDEIEASIKDAKQECAAYEAAIARLAEENLQPMTDEVSWCCCCFLFAVWLESSSLV